MIAKDKKRVYVTMSQEDMRVLDQVIKQGLARNYSQAVGILLSLGREVFEERSQADRQEDHDEMRGADYGQKKS